jgi:hypothetical protein
MKERAVNLRPEYSAQRRSHPPNPALFHAIEVIQTLRGSKRLGKVADLGCGKLRHFDLLIRFADELFLVDTQNQISANHEDLGKSYTVLQVAEKAGKRGRKVHAIATEAFAKGKLGLDVIFCIAVFDVVPQHTRRSLIESAVGNLAKHSAFVVIAPRNDSTILRRCRPDNAYADGHVFRNHGAYTFFHNFKKYEDIIKDCRKVGLSLIKDLSRYRQVCLLFKSN